MGLLANQFSRFCIVGAIGFVVDASTLYVVATVYGVDPYLGRMGSYLIAATSTWQLNRLFTFATCEGRKLHREWAHYVTVNAIGGGINYAVYALSVFFLNIVRTYLVLGVAAGSVAGLAFNFAASKRWVFKEQPILSG